MIIQDSVRTLHKHIVENNYSFSKALKSIALMGTEQEKKEAAKFSNLKFLERKHFLFLKYDTRKMFDIAWDPFISSCRGLVVNLMNNELVLYPFDKFFELDEHKSTKLKKVEESIKRSSKIELTEKIDGSLIIARWYESDLFLVSSNNFDGWHADYAKGLIENSGNLIRFIQDHSNYTIVFEMKNTQHQNLIKYQENNLTIIGMRNMDTHELLWNEEIRMLAAPYGVEVVKVSNEHPLKVLGELNNNDNTKEGYVLRTDDVMVKLKYKLYNIAHGFKGNPNQNMNIMIQAINEGIEELVLPLVVSAYRESYIELMKFVKEYEKKENGILYSQFQGIDFEMDEEEFVATVLKKFGPTNLSALITLKRGKFIPIGKDLTKKLKKYADYFICLNYQKYAQKYEKDEKEVLEDIQKGRLNYLSEYTDNEGKTGYILPMWQFLKLECK